MRSTKRYLKALELAEPFLRKNELGVEHTKRVLRLAMDHFPLKGEEAELVYTAIALHDVGGSSVKDQQTKGPRIAVEIMKRLGYSENIIKEVCSLIRAHHYHLSRPSWAFKILHDCDQLAKFSREEFPFYKL